MSDFSICKKILYLAIHQDGIVDRILNDRITPDHFIDAAKSRESKILSRIFKLVVDYFEKSSGSLMSDEVFHDKIENTNMDSKLQKDVIAEWISIKEHEATNDDLFHLLEQIKQDYASRLLDESLSKLQDNLVNKGLSESVAQMQIDLDKIHNEFVSIQTERIKLDITERADQFAEEYMYRFRNKDKFQGIPSGILDIDEQTFGWMPAQLVVFLAPTAGGKSVQLLNCALTANRVANKNVLYFSFEMGAWDCELRTISNILEVPYNRLLSQSLSDVELKALFDSYKEIKGAYFEYDVNVDDPTPQYVESRIRELSGTKGKPDLIVCDYIGNMRSRTSRAQAQHWEKNGDAAEGLFILAKKYNIPIITAQQINRDVFRENRKKREEGKATAYYQDASSGDQRLMHLAYYVIGIEPDKDNNIAVYHPVKMRNAHFDPCITMWDSNFYKIYNMRKEDQEHWKITKGLIKVDSSTAVIARPNSTRKIYSEEEYEDDETLIPWN